MNNKTSDLTVKVEVPNINDLTVEAQKSKEKADILFIANQKTFDDATLFMNALKKNRDTLDAKRKSITRPLDESKNAVMSLFKPVLKKYDEAIDTIKVGLREYLIEQQEKERKIREEAERIAREEQMRIMLEAQELERKKAEEQALLEAKAKEAKSAQEREMLEQLAKQKEEQAKEEVEQIKEAALTIMPVFEETSVVKTNMSTSMIWKAEITDLSAFLIEVANNPAYRDFVSVELSKLVALARATKGKQAINGVRFYQEMSVRTKRN